MKPTKHRRRRIGVVCMECGRLGRHEIGGPDGRRLRKRGCAACGGRGRPIWWVRRHPVRAWEEAAPEARETLQQIASMARRDL